jgi:drug/metabolite transporter (DMT)-like permease
MTSMRPVEWALLVLLSAIWGCSFFFIAVALRGFHPFTLVFVRVALAAPVLLIVARMSGVWFRSGLKVWIGYLILGALNNAIPFSLIAWGETRIDSGSAAIFNATTPIFVGILAHFLTHDERLTPNKLIGMIVGFSGVYLMMSPELIGGLSWRGFGQVAVLGASFMYATAGIFAKRFSGDPPILTAAGMLVGASVLMLPFAVILDAPWLARPPLMAVAAIAALAVVGTAAAYVVFFRILSVAGATNVLLVTFLVPIGALVLGVAVLHETIRWEEVAGMGLIFLGLIAIDGRAFAYVRNRRNGSAAG